MKKPSSCRDGLEQKLFNTRGAWELFIQAQPANFSIPIRALHATQ
jgi:hypothetical protein